MPFGSIDNFPGLLLMAGAMSGYSFATAIEPPRTPMVAEPGQMRQSARDYSALVCARRCVRKVVGLFLLFFRLILYMRSRMFVSLVKPS